MELDKLSREQKIDLIKKLSIKKAEEKKLPEPTGNKMSKKEAFGLGLAQGATLNFQDELSPIVERGFAKIFGDKETKDLYKSLPHEALQGAYRSQVEKAKKEHPGAYQGGNIAGTIAVTAPMAIPGASAVPALVGRGAFKAGARVGLEALAGAGEGAILSGLSSAGETEKDKIASALKGAKEGAILGGISRPATSAIVSSLGKSGKKLIQGVQGVKDSTLKWLQKNPDKIDLIKELVKDKNASIRKVSEDLAENLNEKISQRISAQEEIIDRIVKEAGDAPISAEPIIKAIDGEISKLKGGISTPTKQARAQLEALKESFISEYTGENASRLTAGAVDALRKEINPLSSKAFQASIGDNPVTARAYKGVADGMREALDSVDSFVKKNISPERAAELFGNSEISIRKANKNLKNIIDLQKDISKKFGAQSFGLEGGAIDPADVQKILVGMKREGKASAVGSVEQLSKELDVDIPSRAELVDVVKTMNEDAANAISKIKTGFSLYTPLVGMAAGGLAGAGSGADIQQSGAMALGGLGLGAAAQSRGALKMLMNAPKIGGISKKAAESIRKGIVTSLGQRKEEK